MRGFSDVVIIHELIYFLYTFDSTMSIFSDADKVGTTDDDVSSLDQSRYFTFEVCTLFSLGRRPNLAFGAKT